MELQHFVLKHGKEGTKPKAKVKALLLWQQADCENTGKKNSLFIFHREKKEHISSFWESSIEVFKWVQGLITKKGRKEHLGIKKILVKIMENNLQCTSLKLNKQFAVSTPAPSARHLT